LFIEQSPAKKLEIPLEGMRRLKPRRIVGQESQKCLSLVSVLRIFFEFYRFSEAVDIEIHGCVR
jgi:hypothetical protein